MEDDDVNQQTTFIDTNTNVVTGNDKAISINLVSHQAHDETAHDDLDFGCYYADSSWED